MDCTQVNGMLDLLMDGALSDEQRRAMEAHGRECPRCAAEMRATLQMKALFEQMEPEADVPLEAQARWRGAVRQEAKKQKQKRLRRWVASVAAAIVVLVGVGMTLTLNGAPKQSAELMIEESADAPAADNSVRPALAAKSAVADAASEAEPGAVVEADGMAAEEMAAEAEYEAADGAAAVQRGPSCEFSLKVKDVGVACARVCDLAQEYEASADVQTVGDGSANVYVDIAADNAGDFLSAVAAMDGSGRTADVPDLTGGGRVLVLLVIHE